MGIDNKNIIEGTDIPNNSSNEFNEKFKEYKGFKEFQDFLDTLDKQKKDEFLKIIEDNKNNPNIEKYLNFKKGRGFPDNIEGINHFIKKYGGDNKNIDNKDIFKKNLQYEIINTNIKITVNKIKNDPLFEKFFTDKIIKETEKNPEYQEWLKNNKDKTVELFIIEKNYTELLNIALETDKKKGINPKDKDSNFSKLFTNLRSLQDSGLNIKVTDLDEELNRLKYSPNNAYHPEEIEVARLNINTSEYHRTEIDGNKITYGDQVIDISTNPPKKFIKGENGFLLESGELNFEIDKETRKETSETKNSLDKNNKEIELNDKKLKDTDYYLNLLKNDEKGISGLSGLWGKEINGKIDEKEISKTENLLGSLRDKYESNEQYKNTKNLIEELFLVINISNEDGDIDSNETIKIQKLQKDIEQTLKDENKKEIESIEKIKAELLRQKEELEKSKKELEIKLNGLNKKEEARKEEYKKSIIEKDQETRKNLGYLELVGLTKLENSLNQTIDYINTNLSLVNGDNKDGKKIDLGDGYKINSHINLAKGNFGQSDLKDNEFIKLQYLTRLANKIFSGDPNNPLPIEGISKGTIKEYWNNTDLMAAINKIKKNGTDISLILTNLFKPLKGKDEEKQPTKNKQEENKPGKPNDLGENKPNKEAKPEKPKKQ